MLGHAFNGPGMYTHLNLLVPMILPQMILIFIIGRREMLARELERDIDVKDEKTNFRLRFTDKSFLAKPSTCKCHVFDEDRSNAFVQQFDRTGIVLAGRFGLSIPLPIKFLSCYPSVCGYV